MTTEIFEGNPESLKERLDVLIVGGATSLQVILTNVRAKYVIIWS